MNCENISWFLSHLYQILVQKSGGVQFGKYTEEKSDFGNIYIYPHILCDYVFEFLTALMSSPHHQRHDPLLICKICANNLS